MEQTKAMRRGCTRIGLALLANLLFTYVGVFALEYILLLVYPQALDSMTGLMVISDLSTYGLGGLALWLVLRPLPRAWVPVHKTTLRRNGKLVLEAIGLMYGASLFTTLAITFLTSLTGMDTSNLLDSTVDTLSLGGMFFFLVVVAPVCEELLFRKILFRRLLPMGQRFAIAISALAFGLYHCNLYQFFYAVALGWLFGCIVVRTGSIRHTILLHAMLNLMGSVLPVAVERYPMIEELFYGALMLLMVAGLLLLLRDRRNLVPQAPNLPGCHKAAWTSVGWLLYVILLGAGSVVIIFI